MLRLFWDDDDDNGGGGGGGNGIDAEYGQLDNSLKAIEWTKLNKYNWISMFETLIQIRISVASIIVANTNWAPNGAE